MASSWHVAMAQPSKMRPHQTPSGSILTAAESDILDLGYSTFVPTEARLMVFRGRKQVKHSPIFGSYVFVQFDRTRDAWGNIEALPSIYYLLRTQDIPDRVPELFIDRLRRECEGGTFDFTQPRPYNVGEEFRVMEGPFAGLIAKVRSASPRKRIALLLNGLKLEMEAGQLEKVG